MPDSGDTTVRSVSPASSTVTGSTAGNQHELAECLHVSEEYLQETIACYRDKYGCSVEVDGYLIVFEPCLAVYERFEDTED